jgi:metal-responsive CopG/Arc/MetJ family transcriptional regulator
MTEIISFSLPKGMLKKLDKERKDVARSKFISNLIQAAIKENELSSKNV